jgi:hypothetical protein
MKRPAFGAIVALALASIASSAFAQAQPAAPTAQPAPAARAKWVAPVKGIASIEVIRGTTKTVGNDKVTTLRVKNVSNGAIALLRVDEYWFDKKQQNVSGDTYRHRQPLYPGEEIEITTKSPIKPNLYMNTFSFTHANGKVDAKVVKTFKK